eukprot:4630376-Prymnesium_polylepis.1
MCVPAPSFGDATPRPPRGLFRGWARMLSAPCTACARSHLHFLTMGVCADAPDDRPKREDGASTPHLGSHGTWAWRGPASIVSSRVTCTPCGVGRAVLVGGTGAPLPVRAHTGHGLEVRTLAGRPAGSEVVRGG